MVFPAYAKVPRTGGRLRYLLYLGSAYRGQRPEVFLPGLLGQVLGSAPGVITVVGVAGCKFR
jgi:hypothetical protein